MSDGVPFDPRAFVDADIRYLREMSEGMDGMMHASDVRVAEGLRDIELPAKPTRRSATWNRTLNDAVVEWHRAAGRDMPDLNELDAQGHQRAVLPLLPALLRVADVQQRVGLPLPAAGPGRDADGDLVARPVSEGEEQEGPTPPEAWERDDPRWPPIPTQDFSNLPRQQKGLHAKGFEYMRLSSGSRDTSRTSSGPIDGYLAGLPYEQLLPALQEVNVNPFDKPIVDLGF